MSISYTNWKYLLIYIHDSQGDTNLHLECKGGGGGGVAATSATFLWLVGKIILQIYSYARAYSIFISNVNREKST